MWRVLTASSKKRTAQADQIDPMGRIAHLVVLQGTASKQSCWLNWSEGIMFADPEGNCLIKLTDQGFFQGLLGHYGHAGQHPT